MGYWQERAEKRLIHSEKLGNQAIRQVKEIYGEALRNLTDEINKVYLNYSKKTGLDVAELTRILDGSDRRRFLLAIQEQMQKLGFDVEQVYKPEYIARITRLEALKQQVYWELKNIAPAEFEASTRKYSQVIRDTYDRMTYDIEQFQGIKPSFATLDTQTVNNMLLQNWEGRNYSESIWKNVDTLAQRLPVIIGGAMASGASPQKTQRILRKEFKVGEYKATRLVRTETNYFNNQAELQSYQDLGFTRYEFYAVMDKFTSEICRDHDGKVYNIEDAVVGVNYPPLHPNCRSTTVPILDGEESFNARRRSQTIDAQGNPIEEIPTLQPTNEVGAVLTSEKQWMDTLSDWAVQNSDKTVEKGIIIDRKTGEILESASGNYGEINFTQKQWREVEDNILVHTHPYEGKPTSFSPPDIVIALNKGAYETVVVSKGQMHHMRFGDTSLMTKEQKFNISEEIKTKYRDYLRKFPEKDGADLNDMLWEEIAQKYGFRFWKDSTDPRVQGFVDRELERNISQDISKTIEAVDEIIDEKI